MARERRLSPADLMGWPTITAIVFFACDEFHAAVHAHQGYRMGPRLRYSDVDRDPHRRSCLLPAKSRRGRSGHEHHGTIVGASGSTLVLFLALTFWPSGDYEAPDVWRRRPESLRLPSRRTGATRSPPSASRVRRDRDSAGGRSKTVRPGSHLLERHADVAALLQPRRHRQFFRAHEIRIEQL